MKRIVTAALAAAILATPVAAPPAMAHPDRYYRDHDRDNWREYREDRRIYREGYRDGRRAERGNDRWDDRRYNGYYYDQRWYYGPPPAHYRDRARYEYRAWRRGEYLPGYYQSYYRPVDWRYARLRPPPPGCHYVYNDSRGEYLLVAAATGLILGIIASQ